MNPLLFYEYGLSKPVGLPFVSTWKTDNVSSGSSTASQVKLPLIYSGTYAFNVDWEMVPQISSLHTVNLKPYILIVHQAHIQLQLLVRVKDGDFMVWEMH